MTPFKIMIIEDDKMIEDELKLLLASNGYETAFPDHWQPDKAQGPRC